MLYEKGYGNMSFLANAIYIFILLCATVVLALTVPLENKNNIDIEVDSVLTQLVKTSKNVPPVV